MALGGEHNNQCEEVRLALRLACNGHWKAHKRQDNDGEIQTSVSWAGRLIVYIPDMIPGTP